MKRLAEIVLKYRIPIMVGTVILTVFFGFGLTRIWINSDIYTYLKPSDPIVQLFNRVGNEYEGNFLLMVGIETEDVFSSDSLELIRDLTESYRGVNGVTSVTSLTDILDIRKVEGILEVGKLVDKENLPKTPQELKRLKDYTLSKEMYRGRIVSEDGRITLIVCRISPQVNRSAVAKEIKSITSAKGDGVKFYYSGVPVYIMDLQDVVLRDVIRLVPVVSFVIILILLLSFRSARGVLLPLIAVIFSTIWTLGLMGWIGTPLSVISNAMPVVLIAIGSAYGIHLISKYNEDARTSEDGKGVTRQALSEVGVPIILAGVTTLIGFLSFFGSYLTAITQFGVYMAIGVGFAVLITITFIPAAISLLKLKRGSNFRSSLSDSEISVMGAIGKFVLRHRMWVLLVTLAIGLLSLAGLYRIRREVDLLEYFPKHSDTRIAEETMRAKFGGSAPIQIIVKGDMKDPFVLKRMRKIEKFIDSLPNVSNTQSVAGIICEMDKVMNDHPTIPETRDRLANLWFFIEGEDILKQLVNEDYSEGLIHARTAMKNTSETLRLVGSIDHFLSEMDRDIRIVRVSDLKPQEIQKIKPWLYGEIAEMVYYDAISRGSGFEIDRYVLEDAIRRALEMKDVKLSEQAIYKFREELIEFFKTEANIILPSEEIVKDIVDIVVEASALGKTSEIELLPILNKALQEHSLAIDIEDLESTVRTLSFKAEEVHNRARVESALSKILILFPEELRESPYFRDALVEDLWVVNEQYWGVPKELVSATVSGESHISVEQTGVPIIYRAIDRSLLKSQAQSLLFAIISVFIILSVQFRSVKSGIITTSPVVFTVLVNFAIMAYFSVPLDIATMMLGGIAIGIGIDYSIHFTSRLKLELRRNSDTPQAIIRTLETTGRAIIINALSVALGFLVLLMGQVSPVRRFGWMVATTMIVSALSAITYLPALLAGKAKDKDSLKP